MLIFCVLLPLVFSKSLYAQLDENNLYNQVHPNINTSENPGSKVNCEKDPSHENNLFIANNGFVSHSSTNETNPFAMGFVSSWVETHGTPALTDFMIPQTRPAGGYSNYASMYSWGDQGRILGEGIAQVIPSTTSGKTYNLSFFKKLANPDNDHQYSMNRFLIVLMRCSDYNSIHTYPEYSIPTIPSVSQIIYSETNLLNTEWEQVFKSFTVNGNYDMVWIFPIQNPDTGTLLSVDFTGLVITQNFIDGNFECNVPLSITGCNYVPNPTFALIDNTISGLGSFFNNNVTNWSDTHGTSDVLTAQPPPVIPVPNYVCMQVGTQIDPGLPNTVGSEGIAAKTPPLTPGNKYSFSFFFSSKDYLPIPAAQNVNFVIVLIKCQNFPNAFLTGFTAPTVPNQVIYCEFFNSLNTNPWKQISVNFTANDNYDMIRIFPEQLSAGPTVETSSTYFGYPELIDVTDFTAGSAPITSPGNCNITLGPATGNLNCSVTNAIFTWFGPNGQILSASSNQQSPIINSSNPANVGTWNLEMSVPNIVLPTGANSCATLQTNIITSSVNVAYCQGPCTTPSIYPSQTVHYYYFWEDAGMLGVKLTSSSTFGNQWYEDGNLIAGATDQIYRGFANHNYSVKVGTCQSIDVAIIGHPYSQSANIIGYNMLPFQSPLHYCINSSSPIKQFDMGASATYTWNTTLYPNSVILNIDPTSYDIHSPNAVLNIGAVGGTALVQAVADLNGVQNVLDYNLSCTPHYPNYNWQVCQADIKDVGLGGQLYLPTYHPGSSGFDWEDYDFGVNSNIIYPDPTNYPSSPFNSHKLHIPGNSPLTDFIKVQFTGSSTYTLHGYYNWGGCYKGLYEQVSVSLLPGCKNSGSFSKESESIIYPNPSNEEVNISNKTSKILSIEILDLSEKRYLKFRYTTSNFVKINISSLRQGVYNCRIITDKQIENKKLLVFK